MVGGALGEGILPAPLPGPVRDAGPARAEADPTGSFYAFEKGVEKTGGKGFADYCGARGASSSGRQDAKRAGAPKDPDPLYLYGFRPVARPVLSSV